MTKHDLAKDIVSLLIIENESCDAAVKAFQSLMSFLMRNRSKLFEPVIDLASYDIQSDDPKVETDYFSYSGVMLFDITYGKPANKSAYLYRSKGIGTFLTSENRISIFGPYSVMDNQECWFKNELYESHQVEKIHDLGYVKECLRHIGDEEDFQDLKISQRLMLILSNVKEVFPREHFIEKFLFPPDFHKNSKLTLEVLSLIWFNLLTSGQLKTYSDREIQTATKKLLEIGISPDFETFVSLINFEVSNDIEHIKKVLSYISKDTLSELSRDVKEIKNKSDDIIEIKPGMGGIALNFVAVFRWIKRILSGN